jgi:hypothetical protein
LAAVSAIRHAALSSSMSPRGRQVHAQRPPGVAFLDGHADLAGDRDRLLAQRARVAMAGLDHERFAELGEHPRPPGR